MKTILRFILLMGVLVLIPSSCKKYDKSKGPTDIRIRNLSTYTFEDIFVDTSSGEREFGNLAPGAVSEYHRFDKAYRQALIVLKINGTEYTFTPVSYTFEVYLGRGKFSYEVWVDDNQGVLSLGMKVGSDTFPLDD